MLFTAHFKDDGTHDVVVDRWDDPLLLDVTLLKEVEDNCHFAVDWPNWLVRITVANGQALYRITGEDALGWTYTAKLIESRLEEGA